MKAKEILYLLYLGLLVSTYFNPEPPIPVMAFLFTIYLPFIHNIYKNSIPKETKFIYTILFYQLIPFFGPISFLLLLFISLSVIDYLLFELSGKDVI